MQLIFLYYCMRFTSAARLSVYFIRNQHRWIDILTRGDYDRVKCEDCGMVAIQDRGSLGYFVVDANEEFAYLDCDEMIIKNIIE